MTIQYPEEKVPGLPALPRPPPLHRFEDTGLEKCVGCSLCAAACPADCIRVVAAENTPEHRVSAGERYAAVYEINLARCIFCGYCEVACPFDAITMGHDYEMSDYNRSDLIFTKEMLLAEPFERTPLRARGRVASGAAHGRGLLLHRGHRRHRRRGRRGDAAQPVLLACSRSSSTCCRSRRCSCCCRREFVAAAQVVVYAGAVMVLYVFVVAYVGGRRPGPAARRSGRGQRVAAVLFAAGAVRRAGHRRARLGPEGDRHRGRDRTRPASARPEQIGELLLTKFLLPFEVASFLLLIAAVGAVVLARRRGGIGADEADRVAVDGLQAAAAGIGTMAEAVGGAAARATRSSSARAAASRRGPAAGRAAGEHRLVPRRSAR